MKPYFAKYILSEKCIEVCDKIMSQSIGHPPVMVTKIDGDFYWTNEKDPQDPIQVSYFVVHRSKVRKVEGLFLCSRDIQLGDMVKFKDISVEVDIPIDEKNWSWLSKHVPWSTIGEISPEATWVKEGMEFDEEEIKLFTLLPPGQLVPLIKENLEAGYKSIVKIKGPCGHFH